MSHPEEIDNNDQLDDQHREEHDMHEEELRQLQKQEYMTLLNSTEALDWLKEGIDTVHKQKQSIPQEHTEYNTTKSNADEIEAPRTIEEWHVIAEETVQNNITDNRGNRESLLGRVIKKMSTR